MTGLHAFQVGTLILTFAAMMTMPGALWDRVPSSRVWLIITVIELQFVGAIVFIYEDWDDRFVWWRAPRIFVVAVLALVYVVLDRRDRARR